MLCLYYSSLFLTVFGVTFDSEKSAEFVTSEPIAPQRIAVLPFDYYAIDKEREYIAEGATQTLINRLAQFANLHVVSHASSMQLKASEKSIADIAKELNVDLVLKGSVQLEGDQVQLSAQLISTENNVQLWSEAKQFKLHDLFVSQNAFSATVANTLQDFSIGSPKLVRDKSDPIPVAAYDSFLRGQYYHYQGDSDLAIAAFEKVIELHPNYALAYAHLSHNYFLRAYQHREQANQIIEKASMLAAKARQIDEYPAYVQLVSALSYQYKETNYLLAEQYFNRAFERNNQDLLLLEWYINHLLTTARFNQAEKIAKHMVAVSPLAYNKVRAFEVSYYRGDYVAAEKELAKKAALLPVKRAQALYVWLALASGNEKALGEHMPKLLVALERQDLSEGFVERLNADGQQQVLGFVLESVFSFTRYDKAKLYAWAGDKEKAIALLQALVEEGDFTVRHLAVEPAFVGLSEHPDFVTLTEKLNL